MVNFKMPNFKVKDPVALSTIISELEKSSTEYQKILVDGYLTRSVIFLPQKKHLMWKKDEDQDTEIDGYDDVVFFSMFFSGCISEDIINQLSEQQFYYYSPFLMQYENRSRKRILQSFQAQLNSRDYLSLQVYFLQKVTNFWGETAINSWRATKVLEDTVAWFDKHIQFGKQRLKEGLVWKDLNLIDPLGAVKGAVTSIKIAKIYSSNARPVLLQFNSDQENVYCIFKRGDDLRQDYAVQTMFFIFNRLWQLSSMPNKPFIHQYKILPVGVDIGFMEFVSGCQPAGEWSWRLLQKGLCAEDKLSFFTSMAASYLACWVLGIRDRHQDNMMIKDNKIFFHIDFGFIFNDAPGFDAPIFSIPGDFRRFITTEEWWCFLKLCGDAFAVLHQNSGVIINACTLLMKDLPTLSVSQVRKYLVRSLMVRKSESAAKHKIRSEIMSGIASTQKEFKYFVHGIAQKMTKQT